MYYSVLPHCFIFFFTVPATAVIYTLSLHDALPICREAGPALRVEALEIGLRRREHDVLARILSDPRGVHAPAHERSEEHTSELQSRGHLVCRLLLEKKKKSHNHTPTLLLIQAA